MFQFAISFVLSFTFLSLENKLIMLWHGTQRFIQFDNIHQLLAVLAINFFLAYSLTHSIALALPNLFSSSNDQEEDF